MNEKDTQVGMKEKTSESEDHNDIGLEAKALYNIDMDSVWTFMGRYSKYQLIQITMLSFLLLNGSQPVLSGMFTGRMINFRCAGDNTSHLELQNNTVDTSSCHLQDKDNASQVVTRPTCTMYEYEGGETTLSYLAQMEQKSFYINLFWLCHPWLIVRENLDFFFLYTQVHKKWDLVCDKETLGQLPQIVTMIGMAVGASTLPHLGDRFGRKKLTTGAVICLFIASLLIAFVENVELFLFMKFLTGAFQQGFLIGTYTMMVEVVPLEQASFVSLLATNIWVSSMCIVGVIGYIFGEYEWRTLQLAFAFSTLPTITSVCFLDESLRWLLGNSNVKETDAILRKVCRVNKKDYNELKDTVLNNKKDKTELLPPSNDVQKDLGNDETKEPDDGYNFKVILYNKNMRKINFVMCYTWMIASMTYYGLTLLSTSLAGDSYVNYFLSAAVELPSAYFMYYVMQKYGRKRTVIVSNFISATALVFAVLVAQFAPSIRSFIVLQTCLTLVGKFFISCSFNTVWIYTPELYPTNLRNVGIGIASSSARIGASFSPLFTLLARKALWAPGTLFGIGCYISVFLLTMMPETRWRQLPRNIQEIDQWYEMDNKIPGHDNSVL